MSHPTQRKPKVKIVFRKGSPLIKIALAVVVVLSVMALVFIHGALDRAQARQEALKQAALTEELEKQELEEDIDALGSADSIVEIAGEELGLVDPDTVVIVEDGE